MKKRFKLLFLVAVLTLFVPNVMAAEKTASTDAELIDAFKNAVTGDTIKLTANIEHKGDSYSLMVTDGKDITLDLNGFNITVDPKLREGKNYGDYRSITVYNGILTIKGKGTIKHETQNALNVWGSDTETTKVYSKLNVEKDVTLEGDTGLAIFLGYNDKGAYGTEINFAGKINTKSIGITTNGLIKHANGPVVNIKNGASITATGADSVAVYEAGNGIYNIEAGTTITGATAAEVRAGILNVKGGILTGTAKKLSSVPNGDGATTVGAGIAVVQHTTQLPITVNVLGGTIKGAEALYVNNTQGNSAADWAKVKAVVTGGSFSTDVTKYVADKYVAKLVNGQYVVEENKTIESTDKKVKFESDKALDNDLKLEVIAKNEEEVKKITEKVDEAYKENKEVKDVKLIELYDINVTDGIQVYPMENGKFTISIALENSDKKYDNYKVVYIDNQGNISETLDAKLVDGKIVFKTTHLSVYGIIGYNNATVQTTPVTNPNTGDNLSMIIILGGLSLLTIGMSIRKLNKNN